MTTKEHDPTRRVSGPLGRRISRTLTVDSLAETLTVAGRLGAQLQGGEVLALVGDLGSGKTAFTKGLCSGLGLSDTDQVCSPTYVLEHIYEARLRVHHFDAYRLQDAAEFSALGVDELLRDEKCVLVIEWADKVESALPDDALRIEFRLAGVEAPTRRILKVSGLASRWAEVCELF